jgi:hypothetical protein
MGKVVPLFPRGIVGGSMRCPCGWQVPRNISIELDGGAIRQIQYDCPECARTLNVRLDWLPKSE